MGYPAGNTTLTVGLNHLATVFYKKTALDVLRQMNRFPDLCEPDDLPQRSGKTVQWYRYNTLPASTTPHAEGVPGVSLTMGSTTVSGTVSEYADFVSISTLLKETSISNEIQAAADELGYRASISVDTITRSEFDGNSSALINTLGAAFTAQDIRSVVATLKAANVRPKANGEFMAVIHPYTTYDLQSDNTAGGFIDLAKYAQPDLMRSGEIGKIANTTVAESTNVGTSGTAPDVLYYAYIVGKGAVGAVDLAGSGPSKVTDPSRQAFKVNVIPGGPSASDPEGVIGGYVSYRFVFLAKTLDSTNLRYRIVKANATLV